MASLIFIMRKSFKNYFKAYRGKALATVILMIVFIGLMMASRIGSRQVSSIPSSQLSNLQFEGYAMVTILVLFLFLLHSGVKNGASFFRMADVNFVFTAPISHQRVLIYGFIKQLYTNAAMSLVLLFQIPNLERVFNLGKYGGIICVVAFILLVFMQSIVGMAIYTFTSKDKKREDLAINIIYAIAIILALVMTWAYKSTGNVHQVMESVFARRWMDFIPIIGTLRVMTSMSVYGGSLYSLFHSGLFFIYMAICIGILTISKVDYYEDVLQQTEYKEEAIKSKKTGHNNVSNKKQKVRKVTNNYQGHGAKAIFEKHLLEFRKTGYLLIDQQTIGIAIILVIYIKASKQQNIWAAMGMALYMLFIFSFTGRWMKEMSKPFIYLIPASSISKIWYATLMNHIKNVIDGTVLFAIIGIFVKTDISEVIICIITYTIAGGLLLYSDIIRRRLFGEIGAATLGVLFNFLIIFVIIIIGLVIIIPTVVFLSSWITLGVKGILVFINGYMLIVMFLMILGGKGLFDHIEA